MWPKWKTNKFSTAMSWKWLDGNYVLENKPTVFNMQIILLADLKINRLSEKMKEWQYLIFAKAFSAGKREPRETKKRRRIPSARELDVWRRVASRKWPKEMLVVHCMQRVHDRSWTANREDNFTSAKQINAAFHACIRHFKWAVNLNGGPCR